MLVLDNDRVGDPPRIVTILATIWTGLVALPFWLWIAARAAASKRRKRNPYAENDINDVWEMWAWIIGAAALLLGVVCLAAWGVLTLVSR